MNMLPNELHVQNYLAYSPSMVREARFPEPSDDQEPFPPLEAQNEEMEGVRGEKGKQHDVPKTGGEG